MGVIIVVSMMHGVIVVSIVVIVSIDFNDIGIVDEVIVFIIVWVFIINKVFLIIILIIIVWCISVGRG